MRLGLVSLLLPISSLIACGAPESDTGVVRLVDLFAEATVSGTSDSVVAPEPTEWRFEDGDHPWKAGRGTTPLEVREGRLSGRSTSDVPIVHVERTSGLDDGDVLHAVVVRARISAGANLSVSFESGESLDLERIASRVARFPWPLSTPILAGDDIQTYTLNASSAAATSFAGSRIRHVLLRPTDAAEADFEIESVRLVFRAEHLAEIPSGVSWQGLAEVYRESIVSRSPETVAFAATLPEEPLLDLALGTVHDGPVTFSVDAASSGETRALLRRTVTTPDRWEEVTLDLAPLSGREVELTLRVDADAPGAIGLWGAPALRSRVVPGGDVPRRPRGVVVILLDTLRRDHLEAYGYDRATAPSVAALAAEGVLFEDAIAQGAWTKVSAPSILSSTYPTSNGIHELFHKLPASADTLAESFRAAGYTTWGGTANGFSGRANNLHQGVEILHERGSLDVPDGQSSSKTARLLVDALNDWLDRHREVPFFVFLHPIDPHSPYRPYSPYDGLWTDPDRREWFEESLEKLRPVIEEKERNGRLPHREDLEGLGIDPAAFDREELGWYDGSIKAADVEIGRVLEKLEELGLEDETLVVFLSDHGEEFRDHGGGFHEDNLYGELVNVPLVLRWPAGLPSGHVVEETVEMLDVAPTILELAGIAVPDRMQGESLLALLLPEDGRRWTAAPAFAEWKRRTDQLEKGGVDAFTIVHDGYKLVHNVERPEGVAEFELYDHANDPLDQRDLSAEHPEIVERLAQQLQSWRAWARANALPTNEEALSELDSEELERLRSLGYVN